MGVVVDVHVDLYVYIKLINYMDVDVDVDVDEDVDVDLDEDVDVEVDDDVDVDLGVDVCVCLWVSLCGWCFGSSLCFVALSPERLTNVTHGEARQRGRPQSRKNPTKVYCGRLGNLERATDMVCGATRRME